VPGRVPTGGGASSALFAEGTAVYVTAPRAALGTGRHGLLRHKHAGRQSAAVRAVLTLSRGRSLPLCRWCACPTAGCTLCKRSSFR